MNQKFNEYDENFYNDLKKLQLEYRKASIHKKKLERRIRNISELNYNSQENFNESLNRLIQNYYKDCMSGAIKRGLIAKKLKLSEEFND